MKTCFTCTLALLVAFSGPAIADENVLIDPGAQLFGASQTEWSARWWQWAFSFERSKSPVADRSGEYCASRQSGEVWFLAGTYGSRRIERECSVPYGKTLFFPLINAIMVRSEGSNTSCAQLASRAIARTDNPSLLVLEIDGQQYSGLSSHRFTADCFSLVPGQKPDTAGSGYYVAIKALSRGKHVLNFGGMLPSIAQAVTYRINVE